MNKVALETSSLTSGHSVRGVGAYTRELLKSLEQAAQDRGDIVIEKFDILQELQRNTKHNFDLIHFPYFHPYFLTLPRVKLAPKTVVTIHDLIQLIFPDKYPAGIKGNLNLFLQKRRLENVDAIITVSETSKKDICRFFGINPEKIHVIYSAASDSYKVLKDRAALLKVKQKYHLPDRFVLYVGDLNYNKNLPNLIKACEIARIKLVICGKQAAEIETQRNQIRFSGPQDWIRYLFNKPHPELGHYESLIDSFKNNNNVMRMGFVPEEDLAAIFNLANLYCQPSYYEGFGLPVIEAFGSGCPVVISRTQALVEIAQEAALIADPDKPEDFASKFRIILDSESMRKELIGKGLKRSSEFSWKKTANETLNVYLSLL